MFRSQYDSDITIWSPQGRLHQIEYASEAVKQGTAAVGLCSPTHAVLLGIKRSHGELASHQRKLLQVDDHIGIAIAGLTSDARVLSTFMRSKALASKTQVGRAVPVGRLVREVACKAAANTLEYGKRPYGVGMLVAGVDDAGAHLFEVAPDGRFMEYRAMALGARSQSARTCLEKHLQALAGGGCSVEELVKIGLSALKDTVPTAEAENWMAGVSVGIVGVGQEWRMIEGAELVAFCSGMDVSE